jgi:hypothetical protein
MNIYALQKRVLKDRDSDSRLQRDWVAFRLE